MRTFVRRRWLVLLILAVVVVAGGVLVVLWPSLPSLGQPDRRVALVRRATVQATIRTIGRVQSTRVVAVGSPLTAPVTLVAVRPGDRVERGDILAELDPSGAERDLARARAALDAAELRLTAAQIAASRSDASPAALTTLYAAGQEARTARDALAQAEELRRTVVMVAPVAATVVSVNIRERQPYGAGGEAIVLNDMTALQIAAEIDEVDLAAALRARSVRVTLDAYPGRDFASRLVAIAPVATQRQGSTIYPASIDFDRPADLDIRPGMSANVALITASKPEALAIPSAAVRRIGERRFVQVARQGGTEQVEIKTGLEGDGQVEVAEGLTEGEVVVLP